MSYCKLNTKTVSSVSRLTSFPLASFRLNHSHLPFHVDSRDAEEAAATNARMKEVLAREAETLSATEARLRSTMAEAAEAARKKARRTPPASRWPRGKRRSRPLRRRV